MIIKVGRVIYTFNTHVCGRSDSWRRYEGENFKINDSVCKKKNRSGAGHKKIPMEVNIPELHSKLKIRNKNKLVIRAES